jgi:hypothetical protein
MQWKYYWRDVVKKHRVIVRGWPDDIPFANLSDISSALPTLEALLRKWEHGTVVWELLTDEAFKELNEQRDMDIESGIVDEPSRRKERKDKGTKRAGMPAPAQAVAQAVPQNTPLEQASISSVAPDNLTATHAVPLDPNIGHIPHTVIDHVAPNSTLLAEQPSFGDVAFDGGDVLSFDMFPDNVFMAAETNIGNPDFASPEFQGTYNFDPFSEAIFSQFAQMAGTFDVPLLDTAMYGGITDVNMEDFTSMLNDVVLDTGADSQF